MTKENDYLPTFVSAQCWQKKNQSILSSKMVQKTFSGVLQWSNSIRAGLCALFVEDHHQWESEKEKDTMIYDEAA